MLSKFKGIFGGQKKEELVYGSPTINAIQELNDFLRGQLSFPSSAQELNVFTKDFFKQKEQEIIDQLPELYLRYEQFITKIDPQGLYTKESLRNKVAKRYSSLLKLPHFEFIFYPSEQHGILLSKLFLLKILDETLIVLGRAKGQYFQISRDWVFQLPVTKDPYPYLTNIEFQLDQLPSYLVEVARHLSDSLERQMGKGFSQRIFDKGYNLLATNYKYLDAFPAIISLIPKKFLDTDKIGLLNKHQLSDTLLEKVNFLEELNAKLAEKNSALRKAQLEIEQARKDTADSLVRLREVLNAVKDGIITANSNSEILLVNKEIERIFGYRAKELLGKNLTMLMPDSYRERHLKGMNRFLQTSKGKMINQNVEIEGLRKDGKVVPLEINISSLNYQGRHLFTAAIRDISNRIQTQRTLENSKKKLEIQKSNLERVQNDLKNTIEELKDSNQELERFAYVASHDLREPLRTVFSYVQLIQRHLTEKELMDPTMEEYISYSLSGVDRMQTLIRDLLEYSRVGRWVARPVSLEIEDIVDIVRNHLRGIVRDSKAVVILEKTLDQPILGDKTQLIQLFQNLISNSIKFRRDNVLPKVWIRCFSEKEFWKFEVEDNGIGIEQAQIEKIFTIFHRLHSTHEYTGTGIGLAICKKIVERFGGRIWVESIPGEGSIFNFTISKQLSFQNGLNNGSPSPIKLERQQ